MELVGELSTRSDQFRTLWARRDVRAHIRGTKAFSTPVVGRLDLAFEVMHLPAEPGQSLFVYTAQPGTPSHDNLSLLNVWAATPDQDGGSSARPSPVAQQPTNGGSEPT